MRINPPTKLRIDGEQGRTINSSINSDIFKSYDIRGVYPSDINRDTAYLLGRAYVEFLRKRFYKSKFNPVKSPATGGGAKQFNPVKSPATGGGAKQFNRVNPVKSPATGGGAKQFNRVKIVVGRDNRLSSPVLSKALIKGIIDSGADVLNIGLSTTPMLYFATAYYKLDGGIEISASHNPPGFNGFKLVREKAIPISGKSGLKEIKKLVTRNKFLKKKNGKIVKKNVISDYLNFNLKDLKIPECKPLKLVVDTANAVSGILIPHLKKKIKSVQIEPIFLKLDGNFPNHFPDPLVKKNLRALQKEVKTKKADLGLAFDGDGDRIIFIDEKGRIISADFITALIAKLILKKNPGKKILYDLRSSKVVRETIEKNKGIPVKGRVGHSLIKEKMRKENIFFAGEFSGHYYLKSHYFCEAPFFVLFKILGEMAEKEKKISELIKPYKLYFHSGEINFKVPARLAKQGESEGKDKKKILKILERKYKKGKISKLDGLRIDFKDWWFNVRPSNTENLLRLNLEAKTRNLLKEKQDQITKIIKSV